MIGAENARHYWWKWSTHRDQNTLWRFHVSEKYVHELTFLSSVFWFLTCFLSISKDDLYKTMMMKAYFSRLQTDFCFHECSDLRMKRSRTSWCVKRLKDLCEGWGTRGDFSASSDCSVFHETSLRNYIVVTHRDRCLSTRSKTCCNVLP